MCLAGWLAVEGEQKIAHVGRRQRQFEAERQPYQVIANTDVSFIKTRVDLSMSPFVLCLKTPSMHAHKGKNAPPISPLALEAVKRIDVLFDIERGINGKAAEQRLAVRQELSAPVLADLRVWPIKIDCISKPCDPSD